MIVLGGVLFLAVATSPVRVVRVVDDGCPSGAEVDLALASMLTTASGAAPASQDVAKLERRADKLRVELTDPDGVVIAERTLDGTASCAELGRMAAIVIASWESDVHPEFVRQPAEIVRVERAPPVEKPAAPPPPAASYDVAAGVTLGQADTVAAGASIGGAWFPRGTGPGFSLVGAGDLARTITVGTHEARWQRWTASLELAWRWAARDRLVIDPHGGVTVGWLSTEGVDYTQNRPLRPSHWGRPRAFVQRGGAGDAPRSGLMCAGPTSRDGTPFTGPEGPPWTRRPPRAGAVSPASASRSGGPPFPGKVRMAPGSTPGVVSAPGSDFSLQTCLGIGRSIAAVSAPPVLRPHRVRRCLPRPRQDGLPVGQPAPRSGRRLRGRGAGGVHRRAPQAAAVRRRRRDHHLAIRDHRARRPGLAAASPLVVLGDRTRAQPQPRPRSKAPASLQDDGAWIPSPDWKGANECCPVYRILEGFAEATGRPSSSSSWRAFRASASPRSPARAWERSGSD